MPYASLEDEWSWITTSSQTKPPIESKHEDAPVAETPFRKARNVRRGRSHPPVRVNSSPVLHPSPNSTLCVFLFVVVVLLAILVMMQALQMHHLCKMMISRASE